MAGVISITEWCGVVGNSEKSSGYSVAAGAALSIGVALSPVGGPLSSIVTEWLLSRGGSGDATGINASGRLLPEGIVKTVASAPPEKLGSGGVVGTVHSLPPEGVASAAVAVLLRKLGCGRDAGASGWLSPEGAGTSAAAAE